MSQRDTKGADPPGEDREGAQDPPSPGSPSLGALLRALFQAGATDDVVTKFVPLFQNMTSAQPQPPAIDLGPALSEAAHAAGVEVARGILAQMAPSEGHAQAVVAPWSALTSPRLGAGEAARDPSSQAQTPPPKPTPTPTPGPVLPVLAKNEGSAGHRAVDAMVNGQIYRFNVAGRRTSVSLPEDLLESARKAFGDAGLKEVVRSIYSQVPPKKTNRSAFVRDVLKEELGKMMSPQLVIPESVENHGSIH